MPRLCPVGYALATPDGSALWVGARPGDCPSGLAPLSEPLPRPPPFYPDRLTAQQVARALLAARGLVLRPVKMSLP